MTTKKEIEQYSDEQIADAQAALTEQEVAEMERPFRASTSTDENGVYDLPPTALVPVDTSFKVSIPENATVAERLTFMLFMGDSESLWNQVGNVISFVGAVATDGFKRDEAGALVYVRDEEKNLVLDEEGHPLLIPCKYTFWRSEDARLYHAQSMTAYGYLRDKVWPVMGVEGRQGMFLAPLRIKIGQKRTRNGRMTFKFDIV